MKDKVFAFISGAITIIIPRASTFLGMLGDFWIKAITTAALGAVGGEWRAVSRISL